ncbi:MAG: two-component system response regulator CreB [Planctomycetota bacterium]|jgi:two-component system catabolic regulation response regulator CreB
MSDTVLIVEDEPAITDAVEYALRTEGFETLACTTGAEARLLIAEREVALVVLDVGLPDMSGFDLCRTLRESSAVPVLFLTARSDEVDRIVGLEIGGDDYMVKPFSPRELTARVRAILRRTNGGHEERAGEEADSLLRYGPFLLDRPRRRIEYSRTELELSRYEYQLLELMLNRPGWVYTRAQLMEQVWDEPDVSFERTVDTHIKTIRAKLKALTPDRDPIRTHRGIGYSLRDDL